MDRFAKMRAYCCMRQLPDMASHWRAALIEDDLAAGPLV
jgi:hypothetical protein